MNKHSSKSTGTDRNTSLASGPLLETMTMSFFMFSNDVLGYLILNMDVILFQIDANKNYWSDSDLSVTCRGNNVNSSQISIFKHEAYI